MSGVLYIIPVLGLCVLWDVAKYHAWPDGQTGELEARLFFATGRSRWAIQAVDEFRDGREMLECDFGGGGAKIWLGGATD